MAGFRPDAIVTAMAAVMLNPLTGTEPPMAPPAVAPAVSNHPYCFPGEKCQFMARRPALSQPNPAPFRGGS